MAATTTKIGIVNRALQVLGQSTISSLTENSRGAKAMLRAYDQVMLAELRKNTWKFSIKRAQLAASATPTLFGKGKTYPLPGDFIFLAPEEATYGQPRIRDWEIEGQAIISDDSAPLDVRYASSSITESMFDVLFAEVLAYALAAAACEEITNSTSKLQNVSAGYKMTIDEAKKRNSIESKAVKSPVPSTISVRL